MAQYLRMNASQVVSLSRLARIGKIVGVKTGDAPHRLDVIMEALHPAALGYIQKYPDCYTAGGSTITIHWSLKELNFNDLLLLKVTFPNMIKIGKTKRATERVGENPWLFVLDGQPFIQCGNDQQYLLAKACDDIMHAKNLDELEDLIQRLDELRIHEAVLSAVLAYHLAMKDAREVCS